MERLEGKGEAVARVVEEGELAARAAEGGLARRDAGRGRQ